MRLPKLFATMACLYDTPESLANRVVQKVCQQCLPKRCAKRFAQDICQRGLPNIFARKVCQTGLPGKGAPESFVKRISIYSFPGSWIPHVFPVSAFAQGSPLVGLPKGSLRGPPQGTLGGRRILRSNGSHFGRKAVI